MAALLGTLGCQPQYRPVVSAVNPVGPASQTAKYALAISNPSPTAAGLITQIDFSGDTVIGIQPILPNPNFLALVPNGSQAFAINNLNAFTDISNPTNLAPNVIQQTALPAGANPPTLTAFTFGGSPRAFVPEPGRTAVAILSTGFAGAALQREITVGANPTYVVGTDATARAYVLSSLNGTGPGQAAAIDGTTLSVSATLPVGVNPIYGVETADLRRAFVLNNGSGTVSVINVTNNVIDNANPTIPVGQNPVWADLVTATNELVVLNRGNGTAPGSLSIISIPLCSAAAQPTNPACDPLNPVDGVGFGTVVATVPVGINPNTVSVLQDGSRAYVANAGNGTTGGSVSVVNLVSGVVTATIPAVSSAIPNQTPTCADGSTLTCIYGIPNTLAATTGTPTGKVYVTSGNSNYLTVIETDTDAVDTHIDLQGLGVRVRVTAP